MLKLIGDGKEHSIRETTELLARQLNLTAEDLAEMLPSNKQTRHLNRVYWSRVYLGKAGRL